MDTIQNELLFKYRSFDQAGNNIKSLSNGELWLSSAKIFNDPFDSAFTYDHEGLDGPIAERWARSAVNKFQPNLSQSENDAFVAKRLKEIRGDPASLERQQESQIESDYKKFGVCSLAGSPDNLLMWAHYGGEHTGFVVGFNVAKLYEHMNYLAGAKKEVLDLIKVNYSTDFPRANFYKTMLEEEEADHVKLFFGTKSHHWCYEEEHRLVSWEGSNKSLVIGNDKVAQIILGCRISSANRNTILSICQQSMPDIKIFLAQKDKHKFALRLIPIERNGDENIELK